MLRPVPINCSLPSPDSRAVVRAMVKPLLLSVNSDACSPTMGGFIHPSGGFVHGVDGSGRLSQIANSVVQWVLVDMVNQGRRLFAVVDKPSHSVGLISTSLVLDVPATNRVDGASRTPSFSNPRRANYPDKIPSIRVVAKAISKLVWDNFSSHFKSPLDLVRGVGDCNPRPSDYTALGEYC